MLVIVVVFVWKTLVEICVRFTQEIDIGGSLLEAIAVFFSFQLSQNGCFRSNLNESSGGSREITVFPPNFQ